MNFRHHPLCVALTAALILNGCAITEPRTHVDIGMPPVYTEAPTTAIEAPTLTSDWWHSFNSPQLTALIEEALTGSADIRIAAERITQAELALRIGGASLLPNV